MTVSNTNPLDHSLFSKKTRSSAGWLDVDCISCWEGHSARTPFNRPFIVCPTCGNKRCPKATHHDNACTGSNDTGQPGSAWEDVKTPGSTPGEVPPSSVLRDSVPPF